MILLPRLMPAQRAFTFLCCCLQDYRRPYDDVAHYDSHARCHFRRAETRAFFLIFHGA